MSGLGKIAKKIVNFSPAVKEAAIYVYNGFNSCRYRLYSRRFPIDNQMVVFEAYLGNKYACSPKALFEAMCADSSYDSYKKVWMFKEPEKYQFLEKFPNTQVVKYRSNAYYKYYAQAGCWITNYLLSYGIKKRPGQKYVQAWHGTPLKKIGCDVQRSQLTEAERRRTYEEYEREGAIIDFIPSPSAFYTEKIKSAFRLGAQARILQRGYPRNDALFGTTDLLCAQIRQKLGLPEEKKVMLYAPTWRDDQHTAGTGYTYELGVDFGQMQEKLGGSCVILFRAHYFISNRFDFEKYKGFIYNVSEYDDINDLYLVSDLLITDYSSVFFDYANLKRPMFFYMYDYEKYKNKLRDFYFDIEELPGPVVKEPCDISEGIMELLNNFAYDEKYARFNEKFNPIGTPCSSQMLREIFG